MAVAENLVQDWRSRLQADLPAQRPETHESVVKWLLGANLSRYDEMPPEQLRIACQAMDYRYRILSQRYLGVSPDRAYRSLIQRLGSLFLIRNKVRTWIATSRDRQRTVLDVLQEVIQELLQNDRYMQEQLDWIAQCTNDRRLRDALLLASLEEYCLRPIRNQPLLIYRFVNYLRRSQRGGMTQVPANDLIRLVSDEIMTDEGESALSLLDTQAIAQYQDEQAWEEQQLLRMAVQREFEAYLAQEVDPKAAEWLRLYLQGHTQEAIAKLLDMPIRQVYRLREKIGYHAVKVFALKAQPELVANWLEISLKEHNLGLTPSQWQDYVAKLTLQQQRLLNHFRAGKTVEAIAKEFNLKTNQVISEWGKLYLAAQEIRAGGD
ncbi:MAG: HetZ-related protein 2 [Cyanobacteria bacterium]|nr:HetZ-related protein 2 [Cyanobacteriota bacterium]MDW8202416.1 HetZ-related protein 2 [Cyanobacteriota bacterium SKYGB_h_bin112]